MTEEKKPTVIVSGGSDPVHAGHIRMIREAAQYGDVIVIANSDEWLFRKKGFVYMEFDRRVEILNAIKGVVLVDSVDDSDGTVCKAIRRHTPTYFANGGDRGKDNTPEQSVCEQLDVELLWAVGGNKALETPKILAKRLEGRTGEKGAVESVPPHRYTTRHSER